MPPLASRSLAIATARVINNSKELTLFALPATHIDLKKEKKN
jgi:hypothetical protein